MSTSISISTSAAAAHAHTHARVHYGVSPASCVAMVHVRDSHSSYVAFASVDAVQLFRIGPAFDHVQSLRPPPSFASFDSAAPSLHVSALAGHASNGNIAVALSDGRLLVYSPEYSLPIGAGIGGAMGVSSWALSYQSTLARPATSLAWAKETLLVADTHSIAAYSSTTNWSQTWAIKCAPDAPIIVLAPSPDNHCLASMSMDDCLVKVWVSSTGGPITSAPPRAHSFFYLPHPQPVTSVSWRRTKSQRVLLANCTDGVARVWKWSPKLKLFLLTVAIDPQTVLEDVGLAPSSCFWLGAEAIAPHPQPSVYLSNSASEKMVRTDPELAELVKEYDELVMSGESNGTVLVWGIRNLSRQTGDTSAALVKVVPNCFRPEHFATLACPHTVQFAFNTSLEHLLLLGASAQGTLSCLSVNIAGQSAFWTEAGKWFEA
ncbi:hypothetical protein BCR44DRAFT_212891 [Catenaria anguillulae PL171]|uniref:WD40-repeat-containing domain protein n=1 Tax=Catenaria anguillulae PL171 TaxID=765915 RepID=A0A1Y2HK53_9FUNG|nr:hypothetical protein BCR44DRAFT_212891 [Catenaria anguillulae PL171]